MYADECVTTQIKPEGKLDVINSQLVAPDHDKLRDIKVKVFDVVVQAADSGIAQLSIMNQLDMCQQIGRAVPVDVLSKDVFNALQSCDSKREDETNANPQSVDWSYHCCHGDTLPRKQAA